MPLSRWLSEVRVLLAGCLDRAMVETVAAAAESPDGDFRDVALDCSGLSDWTGDGLVALAELIRRVREGGRCLTLNDVPTRLQGVVVERLVDALVPVPLIDGLKALLQNNRLLARGPHHRQSTN